jgi:uncharacterized protein (TIGR02147 family)
MSIFEFTDYRVYLKSYIQRLPNRGRGELSKLAKHLLVNTTHISQIMSGTRDFSFEQAYSVSLYLGHTALETDYFSLLVQKHRAGTIELKKHLSEKIDSLKTEALRLSERISYEKKLSDQQRAIFYSSWIYSAVHLYTSILEEGFSIDEIATRFDLSRSKVSEILQFLVSSGICQENSGRFKMGIKSTFVEKGSPHLLRHHSNWRIKAIQKSETLTNSELMYSGQFSLSREDFLLLREQFTEILKKANDIVKESKAEDLACLNLDWFWIDRN